MYNLYAGCYFLNTPRKEHSLVETAVVTSYESWTLQKAVQNTKPTWTGFAFNYCTMTMSSMFHNEERTKYDFSSHSEEQLKQETSWIDLWKLEFLFPFTWGYHLGTHTTEPQWMSCFTK